MTVVVCAAHDAHYQSMADISMPSLRRYCTRHGYTLYYDPDLDPREADACKIRIFRDLYATGRYTGDDLFFWIDTDALVMNSAVALEGIQQHYMGEAHYMVGYDPNGINTGTWMARFTSRADHFLRVSWQLSLSMGFSDQPGLFQTALQHPFKDWVKYVPGKVFNSMPYAEYGWDWPHGPEINAYEPGDFVLHAPSLEKTRRMDLLREYAKLAV